MSKAFRTRLARIRDERGFTLTEMIVVVAILAAVLAMVQMTAIMANRNVGTNAIRLDQAQQAKTAVEAMTKVLRTAVLPTQLSATCTGCDQAAFIQGTKNSVQFYANLNNAGTPAGNSRSGPSRSTYSVDVQGKLWETLQQPELHAADDYNYKYCDTSLATCKYSKRVLAFNVDPGSTLFTYYDRNGNVLPPPLDAAELPVVDSIDVVVTVQKTKSVRGTQVVQRVTLPNADAIVESTPTS